MPVGVVVDLLLRTVGVLTECTDRESGQWTADSGAVSRRKAALLILSATLVRHPLR